MNDALRDRIRYALNEDHGHSNRPGSTGCRTCARRTELIAAVVENWVAADRPVSGVSASA